VSAPADERTRQARLGEWACLGLLYDAPAHGWAVSRELLPDGAVGRVWSLSRPLTYRAIEALIGRGWVAAVGSQAGASGPNRTIVAATRTGRTAFRRWVDTPVEHVRDLRSELLLKLVLAERVGRSTSHLLHAQRAMIERRAGDTGAAAGADVVALWRHESSQAALRFLDRLEAR
jgi:DNA-binding PadR family transcriptional regulator